MNQFDHFAASTLLGVDTLWDGGVICFWHRSVGS
jgi:hypothetical protein